MTLTIIPMTDDRPLTKLFLYAREGGEKRKLIFFRMLRLPT